MNGILTSQACGENNLTIRTLGLLAHRPNLLARFVARLTGAEPQGECSIVFFSRVGENLLREWIERETEAGADFVQRRLNSAAELPPDFRWRRNTDGQLTQPAKWNARHIADMLAENGLEGRDDVRAHLDFLQDCLNTEPDIVIELPRRLIFVEIKVLSGEGARQGERQLRLGRFISQLLSYEAPSFALIGPEWGSRPAEPEVDFHSWGDVATWFDDVPSIRSAIRETVLHHGRQTCTMITQGAQSKRGSFGERFGEATPRRAVEAPAQELCSPLIVTPVTPTASPEAPEEAVPRSDAWHFSHLDKKYFEEIIRGCRQNGVWPIDKLWLGVTGVAFAEIHNGRKINPNWMIRDAKGRLRTREGGFGRDHSYNTAKMRVWPFAEVAAHFGFPP